MSTPLWSTTSITVSSDFSILVAEAGKQRDLQDLTRPCHSAPSAVRWSVTAMARADLTVRNLKLGMSLADERSGYGARPDQGRSERNRSWRSRQPWQMLKGSRVGSIT